MGSHSGIEPGEGGSTFQNKYIGGAKEN